MKETKFKYNKKELRLCLFKVALLFSVFAFSGFNENIESAFHESIETELVETRIYKADFSLNSFSQSYSKALLSSSLSDLKVNSTSALFYFNQSLEVQYKALLKENLTYDFSSRKLPFKKIPSTEDGVPHFTLA